MKIILALFAFLPILSICQSKNAPSTVNIKHVTTVQTLTVQGAFDLAAEAKKSAALLGKTVSIVVLDASGTLILKVRGENVGPHNTEASHKKAYTALSTKTSSFDLMKIAAEDSTARNLNTVSDLLLLGGGVPVWYKNEVIGSLGVSGGGGGENDHYIAKSAIEKLGFLTARTY